MGQYVGFLPWAVHLSSCAQWRVVARRVQLLSGTLQLAIYGGVSMKTLYVCAAHSLCCHVHPWRDCNFTQLAPGVG